MESLLTPPPPIRTRLSPKGLEKVEKPLLKEKPMLFLPASTPERSPEKAWDQRRAKF